MPENNIIMIDPVVLIALMKRKEIINILKSVIKTAIKDAPTISLSELDDED